MAKRLEAQHQGLAMIIIPWATCDKHATKEMQQIVPDDVVVGVFAAEADGHV